MKLWEKGLTDRIENEVNGDCFYQIRWLAHHLEEYIERWLGFARLEDLTVADTLRNDLFYVVVAATNIIEQKRLQLNSTEEFPLEEWKYFQNALLWIQKTPNRSELNLISDTFGSFRKKLSNK